MISQAIHDLDGRPNKRALVTVDCTNLAPELSGSELFGHEKGAFTGAINSRDGAVALGPHGDAPGHVGARDTDEHVEGGAGIRTS